MDNITFFRDLNKGINIFAEEVCITNDKVEENLFDVKNVPVEINARFFDELSSRFGTSIDMENWLQFSFQEADGLTYQEHKLMIVYRGGKNKARELQADVTEAHDGYCINYFLDSKKTSVKFYDLDIKRHAMPELPQGSTMAAPFGHGVMVGADRKDAYFMHSNIFEVAEFFNLPAPLLDEVSVLDQDHSIQKVFGLAYEGKSLKPLKLKRYFYPRDPLLQTTVFDE